jgi:predicted O-methyltransferase YrrM
VSVWPDRPLETAGSAPPQGFDGVRALISGVEGWLSDDQALRLWSAAATVTPPGRIVEIGSFRGRSTIVLACGAPDGVEVVAIDPHGGGDRGPQEISPDAARGEEDLEAFEANLQRAGVRDRVRHLRAPSQDALAELSGEIDLLYVDGAHRYRPARADIDRWGARVRLGGTMLIHDAYNAIGVMLAQLRVLVLSSSWRYVGRSRSLAEYRREHLSGAGLRLNALRQLGSVPYFARNMAIKVLLVTGLGRFARLLGHGSGDWPY